MWAKAGAAADGELAALRSAKAFLQNKSGGLEKELHVLRKQTASLELKYTATCQDLETATQLAKKAETSKTELLKLVEEVASDQSRLLIMACGGI